MQILFLCTHNSCRSILSEALFNHLAPAGMTAVSSGSWPSGQVNVRALKTLEAVCISTDGLTSKASDVFEHSPPDIVITVCDRAAGEACPVFFGPALKAHWGLTDPSAVVGSEDEIEAAFQATLAIIDKRVRAFIALPFAKMNADQFPASVVEIGLIN